MAFPIMSRKDSPARRLESGQLPLAIGRKTKRTGKKRGRPKGRTGLRKNKY